jgi:hypothetical protein
LRRKKKVNRVKGNTIEVENPNYNPAINARWNAQKIRVGFNKYEDPALAMYARRKLNEAQAAAAYRFRQLYERGGGAGARAIDYGRERVDGGKTPDPFSQGQQDARKELAYAHEQIGADSYNLVEMFCGQRLTIRQIVAHEYARPTVHYERVTSTTIKGALSRLAEIWGYETRRKR